MLIKTYIVIFLFFSYLFILEQTFNSHNCIKLHLFLNQLDDIIWLFTVTLHLIILGHIHPLANLFIKSKRQLLPKESKNRIKPVDKVKKRISAVHKQKGFLLRKTRSILVHNKRIKKLLQMKKKENDLPLIASFSKYNEWIDLH